MYRRTTALSAIIIFVYLGLGLTEVFTRTPWCDEAWFGNPAYNLAFKGFMGTTVLEPSSTTWKSVRLTGIDRHTYWVMPLNLLVNAATFRVFGFSIFSMRLVSLFWGLIALCAWGTILWKLTGQPLLTVGSVGLIAVDHHFLMQAADGRMDVMAVALGWSAVAAYLMLRERSFPLAVGVSQSLAAMAFFTHPNGVMLALILAVTTLYFDRRLVGIGTAAAAVLPYVAIGAGWAVYIAQSPADFLEQFMGNASGRGPTITTPIAALRLEISHRYMENFGLAPWTSTGGRLNVIPLAMFLAGVAACLLIREIRQQRANRLILIWTSIVMIFLAEMDGIKTHFYLIYLTPLYSILLAVALRWIWPRRPRWRWILSAAMLVFLALQVGRTQSIAWRKRRQLAYDQAVQYLRARFDPKTFIMGGAGLIFDLGPNWNILDDVRLGYDSGKRADVIVIDPSWHDGMEMMEGYTPKVYVFVSQLLATSYQEVYNQGGYRILVRHS